MVYRSSRNKQERTVYMMDGAIKSAEVEAQRGADNQGQWTLGSKIVLGVGGLSLYMLLMTAAYFHTWFEKASPKLPATNNPLTYI